MTRSAPVSTAPLLNRGSRRVLWYSLLSGPVLYMIYFLAAYVVAEFACLGDGLRFSVGGLNGVGFVVGVLTAVTALLMAVNSVIAWRAWRNRRGLGDQAAMDYETPDGTGAMMASTGLALNLLFLVVTIMTGIPGLMLVTCDWV